MGPEIMEMRRLQKALPPRPSFSQLEWALSSIGRVNSTLAARRDELSRQPRPNGVPASVFEALQEMRKEVLEEEAYQQRFQAEAISRLEQRHRLYDAWIQLAYDALSSSLPLAATTTSSSPPVPAVTPLSSKFPPPIGTSGLAVSASPAAGAGGSTKSASDIKRDLFPSEGSTTSATQLSSAAPLTTTGADEDHGDTPVSTQKIPTDRAGDLPHTSSPGEEVKLCSTDRRGCNWLEHETFQLIDGKKQLAEEMQVCPSSGSFKSKQLRWEYVAAYLTNLGIHKTWQQCSYRWNRLWKPFKTVHGYESAILSKHNSYWKLSPAERVDKRLPRNYSIKIYEVLKQNFVKDRVVEPLTVLGSAPIIPLSVCKDEGTIGSPVLVEGNSDADATPEEEGAKAADLKSSSGRKRKSSGWLDAMRKDPLLHRFTVTPGIRLSSCMLAAWDF